MIKKKKKNLDPFCVTEKKNPERALAPATTWFTIAEPLPAYQPAYKQPQWKEEPAPITGQYQPGNFYRLPEAAQPVEIEQPVFEESPISSVNVFSEPEEDQQQVLQEFVPVAEPEQEIYVQEEQIPVLEEEAPSNDGGILLSVAEEVLPEEPAQVEQPAVLSFPNFQQQYEQEFQEPVRQVEPQFVCQ